MRIQLMLAAVLCVSACSEDSVPVPAPVEVPDAAPAKVVAPAEPLPQPVLEPVEEPMPGDLPDELSDAEAKLLDIATRREQLTKSLREFAETIDDWGFIGTAFNEIGIPQARCFAMGTLLGMEEAVAHLNDEGEPDLETMTHDNAHEVRVLALQHSNFGGVLEAFVGYDPDQLILEWNLDCSGKMGIPAGLLSQDGINSFYEVRSDGKMLRVLGDIEEGFADKVIGALQEHPTVEVVSLGSGGGYVMEALKAGEYIRNNGYDTVLWNGCYSACPLVFMAGNRREIWSPYPELGFHQVSDASGRALPFDSPVYRLIVLYLVRMGVEPQPVLGNMFDAAPHEMARIAGHDTGLCDANVATWIQRRCSSHDYVQ